MYLEFRKDVELLKQLEAKISERLAVRAFVHGKDIEIPIV